MSSPSPATMPSHESPNYELDIKPEDIFFDDAKPDDLIIVIMGITGAGKSTFINRFLDSQRLDNERLDSERLDSEGLDSEGLMKVNHGLVSCTRGIEVAPHILPPTHRISPNRRLVLVDTPGFDDTDIGEYEILRRISVWLARVYNREIKIAGLVYLHSMNNTRMRGSANLGHELFSRICGPVALRRVVMASTQWETLAYRPAVGPIREKDLKKFWAESINKGAVYKSIHAPGDIVEVIDHILKEHMVATQIQEELVKLGKRVAETEAAQKLKEILESWVADPKAEELPEDKKEELKELKFPDKDGILDRVKRLIRLRSNREPPCAPQGLD